VKKKRYTILLKEEGKQIPTVYIGNDFKETIDILNEVKDGYEKEDKEWSVEIISCIN